MSRFNPFITCYHCEYEDEDHPNYPQKLRNDGDNAGWSCPCCGVAHTVTMRVAATFRAVSGYKREVGVSL